ncbi:MAG: MFS transporter, partial [Comamonadaceae bacterium]
DRVGRKPVLITSFLTMGLVTFAIAFLPTYETIGVAAPIILVVLRVLQGLAAGAEWGGAALMAVEHAGTGKRGLYGSAPSFGTTLGSLLSTSVMVIVSRANPEAFATFGWRIAFGLSAILVVIGLFIRRRVSETPAFEQAVKSQRQRVPFLALLRYHPLALLRGLSWILISAALGYSISPYSVGWAVEHHGLNRDFLLITTMVGLVFMLVCQTAASRLLDGARRRTVLIASLAFTTVVAALFFPLVATGAPVVIVVAYCLGYAGVGILQVANGSVLADEFPANVAYTGVSLSYNFAYALAGLLPLISVSLIAATGSIAGHVVILVAIALLAFPVALRTPRAGASVPERPVLKPELGQMATDK